MVPGESRYSEADGWKSYRGPANGRRRDPASFPIPTPALFQVSMAGDLEGFLSSGIGLAAESGSEVSLSGRVRCRCETYRERSLGMIEFGRAVTESVIE